MENNIQQRFSFCRNCLPNIGAVEQDSTSAILWAKTHTCMKISGMGTKIAYENSHPSSLLSENSILMMQIWSYSTCTKCWLVRSVKMNNIIKAIQLIRETLTILTKTNMAACSSGLCTVGLTSLHDFYGSWHLFIAILYSVTLVFWSLDSC